MLAQPYHLCEVSMLKRYKYELDCRKPIVRPPDLAFLSECYMNFCDAMATYYSKNYISTFRLLSRQTINEKYREFSSDNAIDNWKRITIME